MRHLALDLAGLRRMVDLEPSISASHDGSSPSPFHSISSGKSQLVWGTISYIGCAARAASTFSLALPAVFARAPSDAAMLATSLPEDHPHRSSRRFLRSRRTSIYRHSPRIAETPHHPGRRCRREPTCTRRFQCRSRDRPPFGSQHMRHVLRASWCCPVTLLSESWCPLSVGVVLMIELNRVAQMDLLDGEPGVERRPLTVNAGCYTDCRKNVSMSRTSRSSRCSTKCAAMLPTLISGNNRLAVRAGIHH